MASAQVIQGVIDRWVPIASKRHNVDADRLRTYVRAAIYHKEQCFVGTLMDARKPVLNGRYVPDSVWTNFFNAMGLVLRKVREA